MFPEFQSTMEPAIKHARRAVEFDDESPFAHSILGWVLLSLKNGEYVSQKDGEPASSIPTLQTLGSFCH